MLGHSSLKTTEIYLESLPTDILDSFNENIATGLININQSFAYNAKHFVNSLMLKH